MVPKPLCEHPVEFTGTHLNEINIKGALKLYSAGYRISYEGDETR